MDHPVGNLGDELFRLQVEQAADAFFIHDFNGKIITVNSEACLSLGYTRDELLGMNLAQLERDFDIVNAQQTWGRIPESGHITVEGEQIKKDGGILPVESHLSRFDAAGVHFIIAQVKDTSERKKSEFEKEMMIKILSLMNTSHDLHQLIQEITGMLQELSKCEAVGIRLKEGDDYPYYETRGFPPEFVEMERTLCAYDAEGKLIRDSGFNPVLECMCGNILQGRTDPNKSFFTKFGSFWSNNTTHLLATTTDEDRQARTRNRCNGEGYESVALIPLRVGKNTIGLIQLNSKQENRFSLEKIAVYERLAGSIAIGLSERQAYKSLRENEERYRSLFDNMLNGFAYCKMVYENSQPVDFLYLKINDSFERLTGLHGVEGKLVSEVIPGLRESDPGLFAIYGRVASTGQPEIFETYVEALKDWYSISVYCPKKQYFVAVFDVITQRKKAEEKLKQSLAEKEVLIRELYHRTKNNMQVISSLLNTQIHFTQEEKVKEVFQEMSNRIQSMALVQQKLYQSKDLSSINLREYCIELSYLIMKSYGNLRGKILLNTSDLEDVRVLIDSAIPCGLIINELISNSFKHGFNGRNEGEIKISLCRDADQWITLSVSDNGSGLPEDYKEKANLGLKTVVSLGEDQLQGTVVFHNHHGTTCIVRFKDINYEKRI